MFWCRALYGCNNDQSTPELSNASQTEPKVVSKQGLYKHTTLPHLALLQLLPAIYGSDLDTDHVLVAVVRREVTHRLRLLDPRIPGDGVLDVVANDVKARLAVLKN